VASSTASSEILYATVKDFKRVIHFGRQCLIFILIILFIEGELNEYIVTLFWMTLMMLNDDYHKMELNIDEKKKLN
jgi:hypothetical protein